MLSDRAKYIGLGCFFVLWFIFWFFFFAIVADDWTPPPAPGFD